MRRVFVYFRGTAGKSDSFHGSVIGVSKPGTQRGLFVLKDSGEVTYVARATYRNMWCFSKD